jgi:hypothetical protein
MQPVKSNPRPKAAPHWRQDVVASSINKVMCECGAIYEPVKGKSQFRRNSPFRCILCNRELPHAVSSGLSKYRLIWRPDDDRD